ncbi:phosphoenolpyruvate carboxylase [Parvularcula sp. LCG005]|uniref:phosphoenolpyruvate carboxylase n=1 Tax=Parvularcula sp. LCG005 TaxID=3078805 RepID=UPI0029433FDB|nr:phosphoenolpyruvate carboxylase [Parvularcula sp. LCG005]WOI53770.1 phosphoenolpyruvate carboxylase [Parvularcula sp. LCG005]
MSDTPSHLAQSLIARLEELRLGIKQDPLHNPVRRLSHELSKRLQAAGRADHLEISELEGLIDHLDKEAFARRAQHVDSYLGTDDGTGKPFTLETVVERLSDKLPDFKSFKTYWTRRRETLVFTGHPTFLLSRKSRDQLAHCADDGTVPANPAGLPDRPITLDLEHEQAEQALVHAANTLHELNKVILAYAKKKYPDQWLTLDPQPVGLGTWVGYDMDGRNDIGWASVIRHRLHEKERRLALYMTRLEAIGEPVAAITEVVGKAHARAEAHVEAFAGDLTDADKLTHAANTLTSDESNVVSLKKIISDLTKIAEAADDKAIEIAALRAEMQCFALGMGDIHFRLNAAQIRHTAKGILNLTSEDDLFGRGALEDISDIIAEAQPKKVNFGALATERASAARLFIAMAQILKHIDADSPIRLLIAECENPVTVLAAIYEAKIFGVDHKVDVCPLFETALSLDRGRRILDVLFRQRAYRSHVERRGRVAIETGFSDAGRFMGQVPAGLAIERLQGQLADEMGRHDLGHLEAIVYDTHGESMGRGGHPGGIVDRCLYALSPWARSQFQNRKIFLRHEQSFQGGDGYVWFTTPELARRTMTGILTADLVAQDLAQKEDPFYRETSASLDFFNAVKRRQENLFRDPAYNIALNAMGLSLLPQTGSRKSKRQFESKADEETSLRRIRAIPHNAILQQMGFLANILGGVGSAIAVEPDAFRILRQRSDRFDRLMRMVDRARMGSDMKTLIAYMKLYDGSFWATRPISGEEPQIEDACATLASQLSEDGRYFAGLQLAARLRSDSIALSRALNDMDFDASDTSGHTDPYLDLLHAVRIALIQRLFIMAADLPSFTPGGSFSRETVMEAVFSLNIDHAVSIMREAFSEGTDFTRLVLNEKADYPDPSARRSTVADRTIAELEELQRLIHRISVGIANHFGAIG